MICDGVCVCVCVHACVRVHNIIIHTCNSNVQVSFTVDGRSWAIAEMPNPAEPFSSPHPLPPAIVTQHVQQQRRFVLLTAQVCSSRTHQCT